MSASGAGVTKMRDEIRRIGFGEYENMISYSSVLNILLIAVVIVASLFLARRFREGGAWPWRPRSSGDVIKNFWRE
jgi:hypothetical protein